MCAGSCEQEYKLRIVLLPNQEPIGFKVALPATVILSRQLMGTIRRGIEAALATAFRILAECLGHPDFVHTLRCLKT